MHSKTLAKKIAAAALSKKAYDIVLVDLRKLTTMTDFFVICSVDSDTQARAVSDAVKKEIMEKGDAPFRREGYSEGRWVLLDYVDVVVHIFHTEVRRFYNLEKLWGDAVFEHITDQPKTASVSKKGASVAVKKKRAVRR